MLRCSPLPLLAVALGLTGALRAESLLLPPATVAFLDQHCGSCHDDLTKEGNLDLFSLAGQPLDATTLPKWVKAFGRVHAGEMPPKDRPRRPDAQAIAEFTRELSDSITQAETQLIAERGRAVKRRLNRYEYENTLQDLLSLPALSVRSMLPEDSTAFGYNRIGEALAVSHVQVARYLDAAEVALREAIAPQVARPETITKRYYSWLQPQFAKRVGPLLRQTHPLVGYEVQHDLVARRPRDVHPKDYKAPDVPAASIPERREQEAVANVVSTYEPNYLRWDQFTAPVTGRYRLKFSGYSIWMSPDFRQASRGRRSEPISIYAYQPRGQRWLADFDFHPDVTEFEVEVYLRQGETILPDATRLVRPRPPDFKNPLQEPDGMPGVAYKWMEATGPLIDVWPPQGHQLLFGDLPIENAPRAPGGPEAKKKAPPATRHVRVTPRDESKDVVRLMQNFVSHTYRRAVEPAEVDEFVGIVGTARQSGLSFMDAMIAGYTAVLASPGFIYQQTNLGPLNDAALAERLAYFLWNSPPDARLRELAAAGSLREPAVLRTEVDRMLADARVDRFATAFLDYWLDLRKMADASADANLYPEYAIDDYLVESMENEPRLTFLDLLQHDRPARNVVASDHIIINERLARHYGFRDVRGAEFRRFKLPPDSPRGGFMTQAAVLKVTANGTTTSPVLRGVWINERVRGIHTPPPPTGVPAVESDTRGATTIREQLAKHSSEKSCFTCHQQIDPAGFALESFDPMGGWRERYRSLGAGDPVVGVGHNGQEFEFKLAQLVDSSGELPDGRAFRDVRELKRLLLQDERAIARNLLEQLTVYATGAPIRFTDRKRIDALLDRAAPSEYGVRTLIHELVRDELFLRK